MKLRGVGGERKGGVMRGVVRGVERGEVEEMEERVREMRMRVGLERGRV